MNPFAATAVALLALAPILGCSNKIEQKECDKLRGDAFEIINSAHKCNSDADCRQSDWPGCAKPVSNGNFDKIKPMAAAYKKGECDEPEAKCPEETPDVYCKQGLCVHREKSGPAGAGTPPDQIQIQ